MNNNSPAPIRSSRRRAVRPWPLRVIVALLLLQGAGLIGLSLVTSTWFTWSQLARDRFSVPGTADAFFVSGIFGPLGLVALVAALGLLIRLRVAWLLAMLVQAATLLACVQLYLAQRPNFIYPLMLCSVITVLYLNSLEVRVAFQATPPPRSEGSIEVIDES